MENTEGNGGPQADFVGERESSEFKRNLNGGPQADGGDGLHSPDTAKLMSTDEIGNERIIGQQQKEKNIYPQMSQMVTEQLQ